MPRFLDTAPLRENARTSASTCSAVWTGAQQNPAPASTVLKVSEGKEAREEQPSTPRRAQPPRPSLQTDASGPSPGPSGPSPDPSGPSPLSC